MLIDIYFQKQAGQKEGPSPLSASLKKGLGSEILKSSLAYRRNKRGSKLHSKKRVSPRARRVRMVLDGYFDSLLEKNAGCLPNWIRLNKWNWKLT